MGGNAGLGRGLLGDGGVGNGVSPPPVTSPRLLGTDKGLSDTGVAAVGGGGGSDPPPVSYQLQPERGTPPLQQYGRTHINSSRNGERRVKSGILGQKEGDLGKNWGF